MSSKSISQIFQILFQTGDINIFVLRGVFFSRYVQLKSLFSDEKTSAVKSETHFSREATDWGSAKLFIVQNYTENANGDVPLTVENV